MLRKIYNAVVPGALKRKIRENSPYYRRFLELQAQSDAAIAEYGVQLNAARQETENCKAQLAAKEQEIARVNTACQNQLNAARQEIAEGRTQLAQKEQEIASLSAERQAQIDAAQQEITEGRTLLAQKEQEIARLSAERQAQIDAAQQEIAARQAQIVQKEQKIAHLDAEYQNLLDAARGECSEYRTQLNAASREIAGYQTQLAEKNQGIARLDAEYQKLLNSAREEAAQCRTQLAAKEQEVARLTAEWQDKIQTNYADYQHSLKQVLRNPVIREDHACSICGSPTQFSFSKKILNKYDVAYFACSKCRHVQTEKPYWIEEAYQSALSDSDTGQIWRNERNRDVVCAFAHRFLQPGAKVLEYAGGYGLLTRMLRDAGLECFWYDKYAENVFARHFEDNGRRQYDLVLAFEALEHFAEPMQEFEEIFRRGASLLFSEILLPDLCPNQWWYLCPEHGQHVNFYSLETLQFVAERFQRKLLMHGDVGVLTALDISQEDFDGTIDRAEEYAREFRQLHTPLMQADMNAVIRKMEQE